MIEIIIDTILLIVCMILGSTSIGLAAGAFKQKQYFLFGTETIIAIVMILNIIKLRFF